MNWLGMFPEIWTGDFEYYFPGRNEGNNPVPVCFVAHQIRQPARRRIRLWKDELEGFGPPFLVSDDILFIAYNASAELRCFHLLGWPLPRRVLDLFVEFAAFTNGRSFVDIGGRIEMVAGRKLVEACRCFRVPFMSEEYKEEMRDLILGGGPWSPAERANILDYCEEDVTALDQLLPRMLPFIKPYNAAVLRGRYMGATARMECNGVPVNASVIHRLEERRGDIRKELIEKIGGRYQGVYVKESFNEAGFQAWLHSEGIVWPRLESGRLDLKKETFKDMARIHPKLRPLYEVRVTLKQFEGKDCLPVGSDGRNRSSILAFGALTSRNAQSTFKAILARPSWMRNYIRPSPGVALASIDWSAQEFGIAAVLSGDQVMQASYLSGDPYLDFAKRTGLAPSWATKKSHETLRDLIKICVLGIFYGMGCSTLSYRIGKTVHEAQGYLDLFKKIYPVFWKWREGIPVYAYSKGKIETQFSWPFWVNDRTKTGTLLNFPMQGNGAEMMRLACCLTTEQGIQVDWPLHDSLLIESPLDRLEEDVSMVRSLMGKASEIVLLGFTLRTDAQIIRYPDSYFDSRGEEVLKVVKALL
jgi:DNA polymerase I